MPGDFHWSTLNSTMCDMYNGTWSGPGCIAPYPDVFFFSVILYACTFAIAVFLKEFKFTPFFASKVNMLLAYF